MEFIITVYMNNHVLSVILIFNKKWKCKEILLCQCGYIHFDGV